MTRKKKRQRVLKHFHPYEDYNFEKFKQKKRPKKLECVGVLAARNFSICNRPNTILSHDFPQTESGNVPVRKKYVGVLFHMPKKITPNMYAFIRMLN